MDKQYYHSTVARKDHSYIQIIELDFVSVIIV